MYDIFAAIVIRLYVNNLINGQDYLNVSWKIQVIRYYLIPGAKLSLFEGNFLRERHSMLRVRYIACLVTTWVSNVQHVCINEQLISCERCLAFLPCLTVESDKRSFFSFQMCVCVGKTILCPGQHFAHELRAELARYMLCRLE